MGFLTSSSALGANGTYTSQALITDRADKISGSVFADQAGTLYIEQSNNGTNWDISTSYPVAANDGKGFSEDLLLPYVRVRYVNGGTAQGTFRISARYTSAGSGT